MIRHWTIGAFMASVLLACSQRQDPGKEALKLNCILFGTDSIACYYGHSDNILNLKSGKISDSVFMSGMIETAKKYNKTEDLLIELKPADVADVGMTIRDMVSECKMNGLSNYSLDTLNGKEREVFNTVSMQLLLNKFNHISGNGLLPDE